MLPAPQQAPPPMFRGQRAAFTIRREDCGVLSSRGEDNCPWRVTSSRSSRGHARAPRRLLGGICAESGCTASTVAPTRRSERMAGTSGRCSVTGASARHCLSRGRSQELDADAVPSGCSWARSCSRWGVYSSRLSQQPASAAAGVDFGRTGRVGARHFRSFGGFCLRWRGKRRSLGRGR